MSVTFHPPGVPGSRPKAPAPGCPQCKTPLTAEPTFRRSVWAYALFALAVPLAAVWVLGIYLFSPIFIIPLGVKSAILCLIVYTAPGAACVAIGRWLPMVATIKCRTCRWTRKLSVSV